MQRDDIEAIKAYPLREFTRGQTIMLPGQPADTLYVLQTGYARVDSTNQRGTNQLIWLAGRYDVIPTESLFRPRGELYFSYTALTDSKAYQIPKTDFLLMCEQSVGVLREVAQSMSAHYDDLLMRLRSVEQSTIRDKLIHSLYYIARRFSSERDVDLASLGLHLSHQDIAQMIGATRETTAIELKKLKDEGLIDYNRTSLLIRLDRLEPLL
ncbi:MAG TPA: Crp/Fnr family transcriptional regulator [Candidatus Saccharimonadales bacterium]|jgi:CRP/FNR family transcriptional regulator